MKFWVGFFTLIFLLFPPNAFAYIDPGTGSFIIQMIIAGAMGALFTVKVYWKKISSYLKSLFSKEADR